MVEKDQLLTIPSTLESISELETFIEQIRDEYSVPDELYGNILISMTEAVSNCIIHGNKNMDFRNVVINFNHQNGMLSFIISDEGNGFDYDHLPDPTSPENIEKTTGRGVFLMRQLSDKLEYSNGGATVHMDFKL